MEKEKSIALLNQNFDRVEMKFEEFFNNGEPRWPGESRDYLRNHHGNLDNIAITSITFESLKWKGLPEPIMNELRIAFNAFNKGVIYQ